MLFEWQRSVMIIEAWSEGQCPRPLDASKPHRMNIVLSCGKRVLFHDLPIHLTSVMSFQIHFGSSRYSSSIFHRISEQRKEYLAPSSPAITILLRTIIRLGHSRFRVGWLAFLAILNICGGASLCGKAYMRQDKILSPELA